MLLVSDANIFIDLEEGDLIETLFELPWRCQVPNILFTDKLEAQHGNLLSLGLELGELTTATVQELERLAAIYPKPSRYDCSALALAKQERCPLLTGDADLRDAAKREKVVVAGTVWLVEAMVVHERIEATRAESAYRWMQEVRRRLPWNDVYKRLSRIATGELALRNPFEETGG